MLLLAGLIALWLVLALRQTHHYLHFFQLEEYDNSRFQEWIVHHFWFFSRDMCWIGLAANLVSVLLITLHGVGLLASGLYTSLLMTAAWLVCGGYLLATHWKTRTQVKKPLVYTQRAKRLLGVAGVLQLLLLLVLTGLFTLVLPSLSPLPGIPDAFVLYSVGLAALLLALSAPAWLILSNIVLHPFEAALRRKFVRMARARLDKTQAVAIGITGSYGKTSTKDMLAAMLATRCSTVKTPQSYNTLMGVCKIINRGDVQPEHEYFVVEAGAYTTGEIADIVDLVEPTIGVLTAIGPQHLERFGSIEAVAKAKYEIMAHLPPNGLGVFNADDERVYALAQQTSHVPVALYGFRQHQDELATRAEDVRMSPEGMRFVLVDCRSSQRVPVQTRLLGMHTVSNLLAAATVALHCGVTLDQIARAIHELPPTPHRLELKRGAGGTVILDDAYNANPVGARNALDVLAMFEQGQRILMTPGFIEMGPLEAEENQRLGEAAAAACDYGILVGTRQRTDPIKTGMLAAGFAPDRIVQVPALQEGITRLHSITRPGDTVLLLNDLPDTYELVAAPATPAAGGS